MLVGAVAGQALAAGVRSRMRRGGSMASAVSRSRCGLVSSVVWRTVPAGPVKVTACRRCSFGADALPGPARGGLGDADQEQREPAEHDVGADAVLAPVIDRPQVEHLLSCRASRARLRAAACSPGRCPRWSGAGREQRSRYLPSRFASAAIFVFVDAEQPAGGDAQEPFQAGLGGDDPAQLGPLRAVVSVSVPAIASSSCGDELVADRGVARRPGPGCGRRRTGRGVARPSDFLDLHVVRRRRRSGPAGTGRR